MMRKTALFAIVLVVIATVPVFAKDRAGTVVLQVDLSAQAQGKEVRLWVPYPVTDLNQTISDIRVAGDFATSGVYTDREHGTPILYAEWPKEATSRTLTFSFAVVREEVTRGEFPEAEPAWNPGDYATYLGATSLGPIDGEVRELAGKITAGKKTVREKARAIYDWVCENMHRDPEVKGCGRGDVCALLKKPGGKCTDISSVFISLCRASGVPTREIFGIRLGKKPREDITAHQHCWVEFFLPGRGWVSVDPADFRKAVLVDELELADPKAWELREYFWGSVDAYRVALAEGRDIMLNPRQAGTALNTFGYPYAEVGGKPLDFYDPKGFAYTYGFTEK